MPTDEQKLWEVWGQANGLYSSWAASKNINYYLLFVLYALNGQEACLRPGGPPGKADYINGKGHCLFQRAFNPFAGAGASCVPDYGK